MLPHLLRYSAMAELAVNDYSFALGRSRKAGLGYPRLSLNWGISLKPLAEVLAEGNRLRKSFAGQEGVGREASFEGETNAEEGTERKRGHSKVPLMYLEINYSKNF